MTSIAHPDGWSWITRLGEATLLLPLMVGVCTALWRLPAQRTLVRRWVGALLPVTVLTTASKVAFMGWGLGSARLDYTGISGHAMFASALLPVLGHLAHRTWLGPRAAVTGIGTCSGGVLAVLVAVSRVQVGAHSWSEVLLGLGAGTIVSAWTLVRVPGHAVLPWHRGASAALAVALPLAMVWAPPSRTHDWVTRLALEASGRREPWQRGELKARTPRPAARTQPVGDRAPALRLPQVRSPGPPPTNLRSG